MSPAGSWIDTLEALRRGESAACDRVAKLVTGHLARLGACEYRETWGDVVQEVLLSVVSHPPRADSCAAVVCHIKTTTYRKFVDQVRRARGRRRRGADAGSSQGWRTRVPLEEAGELPAPDALGAEVELDVRTALGRLDPGEREAVESRYLLGCTNEEAAKRMGVSLATYKRALARALDSLRRWSAPA
jgi:RNA polymerase sigma factor (sigma-70 family)